MTRSKTQDIYKLPRKALFWLLGAHMAAFAPHVSRAPLWLLVITGTCLLWRVMVHRGAWNFPGRWVRGSLVIMSFVAIVTEYGTFVGVEPGVALLVLTFSLKLIEMYKLRDAYVILILSYFVIGAQFLFSQSFFTTAYQIFALFVVTGALISINQTADQVSNKRMIRTSLVLLGQSFPLMVALFVLFPRLGPLWSLDLDTQSARTGLSDQVTPGDIAKLGRSTELAFRAEFEREAPPRDQLYWRAIIMDYYDGRTWSQSNWSKKIQNLQTLDKIEPQWLARWREGQDKREYSVIMEPSDQQWLFSLGVPRSNTKDVLEGYEYRLFRRSPVNQTFQYVATSYNDVPRDLYLASDVRQVNLQLPADSDPETRVFAEELFRQVNRDPARFAEALNQWFAKDGFSYTLEPGAMGRHSIDEFLFQKKEGFCAHYASAFVFMMRTVGIPARMVTGYQGGEVNPLGRHVLVHQFDAHAWAEIWIPDQGWVRHDPTSYIAPDRINLGLEEALNSSEQIQGRSAMTTLNLRNLPMMRQMRYALDMLNYNWNRLVVGYDQEQQLDLMRQWFNSPSLYKMVTLMFVILFVAMGIFAAITLGWFQRSSHDAVDRSLLKLYRKLEKRGIKRQTGETPSKLALRVEAQDPELALKLRGIARHYEQLKYEDIGDDPSLLKDFQRTCEQV